MFYPTESIHQRVLQEFISVVSGQMYYLNSTTSRLSLLLQESEAKLRTGVNNNDNI